MSYDGEDRRVDDARLGRIEKIVMELHSKVNNGLTERGIRTEKIVTELKADFNQHTINDDKLHYETSQVLKSVTDAVTELNETQKGFVRAKNRMLGVIIIGLVSVIGWMITYSAEIAAFMKQISGS